MAHRGWPQTGLVGQTIVFCRGRGVVEHFDITGEMSNWTLDLHATYVDPCTDCADIPETDDQVDRGGFNLNKSFLLPTVRDWTVFYKGAYRAYYIGIRCSRARVWAFLSAS